MWPFDRREAIVVAGRMRAELWSRGPSGCSLASTAPITFGGAQQVPSLGSALQGLFEAARAQRGGRAIHVVLESAWLPVIALDVGGAPWTERKLHALLQHRFGMLFGIEAMARDWDLQADHRAGDAMALGFGLAKEVKNAVLAAAKTAGATVASVQPSFAWGMGRCLRPARRTPAAWWMWGEQDRSLVAHVRRGRVAALNPAADPVHGAEDCRALAVRESIRLGTGEPGAPAWAGGWRVPTPAAQANTLGVMFVGLQGAVVGNDSQAQNSRAQERGA